MLKNPNSPLKERVSLLPASGIGDGLIMMAAAHLFQKQGYETLLYHSKLGELQKWFPKTRILPLPKEYELSRVLQEDAWIFAQNDNSSRIKELYHARKEGSLPHLCIFYVTHSEKKHGELHSQDYLSDLSKTILDNLISAANHLLSSNELSKEVGLQIPPHLQKNRFPNRILLHPTSGSPDKNWSKKSYLLLAQKLKIEGFEPILCVSPREREFWKEALSLEIPLPHFPTLHEFASFLYESKALIANDSFAGHLSSCFSLPTFIIASKREQMQLWQPGWRKAHLFFPPSWIPNWKGFRLLDKRWQSFISVDRVSKIVCETLKGTA